MAICAHLRFEQTSASSCFGNQKNEKTIADLEVEKERLNNLVIENARKLGYVEAADKDVIYVPRSTSRASDTDAGKSSDSAE